MYYYCISINTIFNRILLWLIFGQNNAQHRDTEGIVSIFRSHNNSLKRVLINIINCPLLPPHIDIAGGWAVKGFIYTIKSFC